MLLDIQRTETLASSGSLGESCLVAVVSPPFATNRSFGSWKLNCSRDEEFICKFVKKVQCGQVILSLGAKLFCWMKLVMFVIKLDQQEINFKSLKVKQQTIVFTDTLWSLPLRGLIIRFFLWSHLILFLLRIIAG